MTPEEFQKVTGVSRETLERLKHYHELLLTWQQRINLIGRGTEKDIWNRHFFDSWQLVALINKVKTPKKPLTFLDLGSGAGFPGLVVAITSKNQSYLVEANSKKCVFLRNVIRETGASAEVIQTKIEDLSPFPVDIVTSRALTSMDKLISWGKPFLAKAGEIWLLKGQSGEEELTLALKKRNMSAETFSSRTDPKGIIIRLSFKRMAGKPD